MNPKPCYGCPLRHVEEPGRTTLKRCPILQVILDQVRGLRLTSANFKCPTKTALFRPGQCVTFKGAQPDGGYRDFIGYVVRWDGNKVRVACENTDKPFCRIRPDRLEVVPNEERRVCVHCGLPEGVRIKVKMPNDPEAREWVCREDYSRGMDPIALQCEYDEQGERG
jgi:hypothetical protein